ncbi:macrolide family glycosyltransferase [Staphylococcus edaphicus]|uniref:Glycosyl transferase n=1 Tax=Staphylococcus edaphicus TaxID=1955013 RepID=A0A2C6WPL1_9STAP|nr:macrolide family glycosyltransferase [Staphylococcus edaphicus]PHK50073.1 glycosyl transferase [Staphylococcus edaphicus]UQW81567.1 glycosyl transferase [Staphylococcus edaphicus]
MAKVLFINSGSIGHINPTIAVCKELVSRGEEVVYYIGDQYQDKLADTGVEVRTLPSDEIIQRFTAYGSGNLCYIINGLLNTVDVILPKILAETKDEHYDYLIYDSMFSCGSLIAQKLNIPTVSSVTTFAHTAETFEAALQFNMQALTTTEKNDVDNTFSELQQHIQTTYGVDVVSRYAAMNNPGELNIVYIMKAFQINPELFDTARYRFVGPSVIQPQPTHFMEQINQTRPVIYISLGTVFNQNMRFFNKCLAAFKDIDASVVISIGHTNNVADFEEVPDNVLLKPYVPQTELLQHTTLFLTHAGMNSTNEALLMEVPLLAFPQSADQPVVAQQIEHAQVGQQASSETITAEALKMKVMEMLQNHTTYQAHIKKMKQTQPMARPGYAYAVDQILSFRNQSVHH